MSFGKELKKIGKKISKAKGIQVLGAGVGLAIGGVAGAKAGSELAKKISSKAKNAKDIIKKAKKQVKIVDNKATEQIKANQMMEIGDKQVNGSQVMAISQQAKKQNILTYIIIVIILYFVFKK